MRRWLTVALVATVLAAATAAGAQPGPVSLEFKGPAGSELKYQTSFEARIDVTVPNPGGGSQMLTVTPNFQGGAVTTTRVDSVAPNGDLTMGTKVNAFSFAVDAADFHLAMGIYGPGGGEPQLLKLPELPIKAVLTPQGKPVAIEGLDKLIPAIPGPGGQKIDLGPYFQKIVSQFGQPVFPSKPVKVGDFWEWEMVVDPVSLMESLGVPLPPEAKQQMAKMKFPIKSTSTLVGIGGENGENIAKIDASTPWQVTVPMSGPQGAQMTLNESGMTKVTTWFDYAAGRIDRQTTEFTFDMNAGSGSTSMVKISMKGNAETRLIGPGGEARVGPLTSGVGRAMPPPSPGMVR